MSYKAEITLRSILIFAAVGLFFFLIFRTGFIITAGAAAALAVLQCVLLIARIGRITDVWTRFFASINAADFSPPVFPRGASFLRLRGEYERVAAAFRKHSLETERRQHYMRMIARSVDVGILVLDAGGNVDFSNEAFQEMFGVPAPRAAAEMEEPGGGIFTRIRGMKNGSKALLRVSVDKGPLQLIVSVRDFVLLQEKYTLFTFQNIGRELDESEIDAWQKMARVFNHEIMNSLTPISSLASTAAHMLSRLRGRSLAGEWKDVHDALTTIEKRSEGLLRFVESYRAFLGVPAPSLSNVSCMDLCTRVKTLMGGALESRMIDLRVEVSPRDLRLSADGNLLEQVLINLVRNSIEALGETRKPSIRICARRDARDRPLMEVVDNGRGIPGDCLDRIFVPFFSLHEGGSGIGLSLCRRIMHMHGGTISAASEPGVRTAFTLRFP